MKSAFILVIASLATTITAQALSNCAVSCITPAASEAGCGSVSDLQCICTSTAYQAAAMQCLQSNCMPEDVAVATQLQADQCAGINPS